MARTVNRLGGRDTKEILGHARLQAAERGLDRFTIVDADSHHYENESWDEITEHFLDPVVKQMSQAYINKGGGSRGASLMPVQLGNQDVSGRILRYGNYGAGRKNGAAGDRHPDTVKSLDAMDMMGIDYSILFPTPMLALGMHPQVEVEVAISEAYSAWLLEDVLSAEPRIKTLLYLPFNDPEASLRLIERFGDHPAVVGFMVTSVRYRPVHDNAYAPIYKALSESKLPIAFHALFNWYEQSLSQLNSFLSVHALGFPFYNMVHLTNLVINGIPERYPDLKVIWIESGIAWLPFLMERLDHEYMMRTSEAPLLKQRPSDYMRQFFYTSQPIERSNPDFLEMAFKMIDADTQLLYASDYPHWDFDLPAVIYDLPFLDMKQKQAILGGNAVQLFGLQERAAADTKHEVSASDSGGGQDS